MSIALLAHRREEEGSAGGKETNPVALGLLVGLRRAGEAGLEHSRERDGARVVAAEDESVAIVNLDGWEGKG